MLRKIIFSGVCCLLICLLPYAQSTADISKGDICIEQGNFGKAAAFYKKAAKGDSKNVTAMEKWAAALMALQDYTNAEVVYKQLASETEARTIDKFYYGQVLCINSKYAEAGKAYNAYFSEHPDDPLAGEFSDFEAKVKALLADTGHCTLINIQENSAGSDEGPSFCLYDFCFVTNAHSSAKGKKSYDLYMSFENTSSNHAAAQKVKGKVNGKLDEGPATFSRNGREMIFTRSNYGHKSAGGTIKLGLYHADYDSAGKKWINVMPLNLNNCDYNYMQPSLSKDGSTLYFASDMKGGLGGNDIYVSHKQGNLWSAPVNLGAGINTIGNDETPFIADNGNLYFASDSRIGLGGMDIYSAKLTNGVWGNATNLGASFNSAYNDFGFINNSFGNMGYIVSNRPGGKGGNDIYLFTIKH